MSNLARLPSHRVWRILFAFVALIFSVVFAPFVLSVISGTGYDIEKYGQEIGRRLVSQPKVVDKIAAAKSKNAKAECEQEWLKAIAEEEDTLRGANEALRACQADIRHWLLAQSCEINQSLVAGAKSRAASAREPPGC